ncbi:hypothetical protein FACS189488_14860 [Betaproteobacteria bacterium]|nr:hypothetical protein FACS189488_14860 [Betaproteobacteria bacterium]
MAAGWRGRAHLTIGMDVYNVDIHVCSYLHVYAITDIMSCMKLPAMKPLEFLGSSKRDLCDMPADVRHALGIELLTVQYGGDPSDFKPMPDVGAGVYEIRYRDAVNGAFRVMYVAKFSDAVYVLHAFQKKTQQTSKADIALAAKRYKMIGA